MKSVHVNNNHWNTLVNIRYHMYEYLLVFSCDKVTEALLHNVKRYFEDNYGCRHAADLIPHVTLFNCIINEHKVDRIIQGFEKVARHMAPFQIGLTHFSKYEHGTFYVDIENNASQNVTGLVRNLRQEVGNHVRQWAPAEYHFGDDPHITIARNMNPRQVQQADSDWLNRKFEASFEVNEMTLLKRSLINGSRYEVVQRFPFLNVPVQSFVQASLF